MDEAWGDRKLTWETWHVVPATATLVTSSPQHSVAFVLRGVIFFRAFCHLELLTLSHPLWQSWVRTLHPIPMLQIQGLNEEEQTQKLLSRSFIHLCQVLGAPTGTEDPPPKSSTFLTFQPP